MGKRANGIEMLNSRPITNIKICPTPDGDDSTPLIAFRDSYKCFEGNGLKTEVLSGINLAVGRGEFLAIVGPSGSGKSTLLNVLAGLDTLTSGSVEYNGRPTVGVTPGVGYMTQDDSLLPWRTVSDNIAVPLEIRAVSAREIRERVDAVIKLVGLVGFGDHYPRQLSGGMRKRAMLARTLVYDPSTILMDEPFGPLDAQLKVVLQAELLRIWSYSKKTIIFVTHDIVEAITLADRVAVLSSRPGRVKLIETIQLSRPRDVHAVRFMKEFEEHYRNLWQSIEVDVQREALM
jgi:NitT/TauT family transport system ATP-binding protein